MALLLSCGVQEGTEAAHLSHAGLTWLRLSDLEITLGRIEEQPDGELLVRDEKVRAVSRLPGDRAVLRFRYHGPTPRAAAFASGEVRRQIGLKLRAADSCNLLYVLWVLEPSPAIRILGKTNPGDSRHAECGTEGYVDLADPIPTEAIVSDGGVHELAATLAGGRLEVWADGALVHERPLPGAASRLRGPAGLRTDNGRFSLRLGIASP